MVVLNELKMSLLIEPRKAIFEASNPLSLKFANELKNEGKVHF